MKPSSSSSSEEEENSHSNQSVVAIVDDEKDTVELFKEAIEISGGYPTIGFTSPLSALDYIHKHHDELGLALIDYQMPEMKGCELATKIAQIDSHIKMILITAYNDIVNNTLNLEIVKKPIRLSYLLNIIKRYMNNNAINLGR